MVLGMSESPALLCSSSWSREEAVLVKSVQAGCEAVPLARSTMVVLFRLSSKVVVFVEKTRSREPLTTSSDSYNNKLARKNASLSKATEGQLPLLLHRDPTERKIRKERKGEMVGKMSGNLSSSAPSPPLVKDEKKKLRVACFHLPEDWTRFKEEHRERRETAEARWVVHYGERERPRGTVTTREGEEIQEVTWREEGEGTR